MEMHTPNLTPLNISTINSKKIMQAGYTHQQYCACVFHCPGQKKILPPNPYNLGFTHNCPHFSPIFLGSLKFRKIKQIQFVVD